MVVTHFIFYVKFNIVFLYSCRLWGISDGVTPSRGDDERSAETIRPDTSTTRTPTVWYETSWGWRSSAARAVLGPGATPRTTPQQGPRHTGRSPPRDDSFLLPGRPTPPTRRHTDPGRPHEGSLPRSLSTVAVTKAMQSSTWSQRRKRSMRSCTIVKTPTSTTTTITSSATQRHQQWLID